MNQMVKNKNNNNNSSNSLVFGRWPQTKTATRSWAASSRGRHQAALHKLTWLFGVPTKTATRGKAVGLGFDSQNFWSVDGIDGFVTSKCTILSERHGFEPKRLFRKNRWVKENEKRKSKNWFLNGSDRVGRIWAWKSRFEIGVHLI